MAMTKIFEPKIKDDGDVIRNLVYQKAQTIKNTGHTLVLPWYLNLFQVLLNEKANEAAKYKMYRRNRKTNH